MDMKMVSEEEVVKKYRRYLLKTVVEPIVAFKGEGAFLTDLQGKRYLDFSTGYSVMALGYGNPSVRRKIQEQLMKLEHCCHYLYYSIQAADIAEKLAEISPDKLQKSFLCNSGTEAVEGAIRLARKYTKKHEMFALYRGHHGRSMGAASITGNSIEKKGMGPYLTGVHFLPPPYCYRCSLKKTYPECELACAKLMEEVIEYATSDDVACVILEPIMMDVVIVPPDGYLQEIKRICNDHDILFVADEVQSGLGRSGKMFAVEHWKIEPDIMTLGKALGGGLPLGAYIATEKVGSAFESMDYASSCGGNPLACVAGLEMINIIENDLVKNANRMGEYFLNRLFELKQGHKSIGDVRGKGLFIGLELVREQKTKALAIQEAEMVKNRLREMGLLLIRNQSTFRILPPLTVKQEEIDQAVEYIDNALNEIDKIA
jgi:4-aminobutyrate aminotransferase-like enzyme